MHKKFLFGMVNMWWQIKNRVWYKLKRVSSGLSAVTSEEKQMHGA